LQRLARREADSVSFERLLSLEKKHYLAIGATEVLSRFLNLHSTDYRYPHRQGHPSLRWADHIDGDVGWHRRAKPGKIEYASKLESNAC
jgi:hypothetical protein